MMQASWNSEQWAHERCPLLQKAFLEISFSTRISSSLRSDGKKIESNHRSDSWYQEQKDTIRRVFDEEVLHGTKMKHIVQVGAC